MSSLYTRRNFLKSAGILGASAFGLGLFPANRFGSAWAQSISSTDPKLVVINLNGGFDGLSLFQPSSGSLYSTLASIRPNLCLAPGSLLNTSDGFGFHPSLTSFKSLYDEGKMLGVLGVGCKNMSLSHMDQEVAFARGVADRQSSTSSGLFARIGELQGWTTGLEVCSVTGSDPAFGGTEYIGVQVQGGLTEYKYKSSNIVGGQETSFRADTLYQISTGWPHAEENPRTGKVIKAIDLASSTSDLVQNAISATTFPNAYPTGGVARTFKNIEILLSDASLGTRIAYGRLGGYDTHSNQDTVLPSLLDQLDDAMIPFVANLKAKNIWNNTIVLIMSEFGRRNKENGSKGLDHGAANTFFLTGGLVNGGIEGSLASSDLTNSDLLPMKYNIVEVYWQILAKMNLDPAAVFGASDGPSLSGIFV